MSLYDKAIELQLQLETAQSADSSVELVSRADNFVDAITTATDYLNAITRLKTRMSIDDSPSIDAKAAAAAISAFRAGLAKYGVKAIQQKPAAKLMEVARDQRVQAARWAGARWRAAFDDYEDSVDKARPGRLVGGSTHRISAERQAIKLDMLRRQDPILNEDKVIAALDTGGGDVSWLDRLDELHVGLNSALQALEAERAALTPEVREALETASSEGGLSLAEVTTQLLDALHAAGVDEDLVVRRR